MTAFENSKIHAKQRNKKREESKDRQYVGHFTFFGFCTQILEH